MKHDHELVTSYYRLNPQRFGRLLLIGAKVIYYQVDVMSTGYYTMMSILLYGTFILTLLPTSYLIKTVSSSDVAIAGVCKYQGYACSNHRT